MIIVIVKQSTLVKYLQSKTFTLKLNGCNSLHGFLSFYYIMIYGQKYVKLITVAMDILPHNVYRATVFLFT